MSGAIYQWVNPLDDILDAPLWLLSAISKDTTAQPAQAESLNLSSGPRLFVSNSWTESDARGMLSFISADLPHEEWVAIGMALKDEGFNMSLWDEWSRTAAHRYQANVMGPKWKSFRHGGGISFGTLVSKAKEKGWMYATPAETPMQNNPPKTADCFAPSEKEKISIPTAEPASVPAIKFTGLIADTIQDILATSQMPQPELAVLNVLAALGAVFGRRYASPMNTRTNLYTVGIAPTGAGKDHSRKYIKNLMLRAELVDFLGDDSLVSGAGLIASLEKKPSQVMHLDEFGMVLAEIKNKNSASYMKICAKIFTEFYSTSNSYYYGGQYADPKREPARIKNPNLCIYGSTTMAKYIEAMDRSVIESGEINRYIIIKPEIEFPERIRGITRSHAGESIVEKWKFLVPLFGVSEDSEPVTVTWEWLDERIWDIQKFQDAKTKEKTTGPLWSRYAENIIKVAMIMAISRNQHKPNIENEDLDAAEMLVKKSVEYMVYLANNQMYGSVHEKECNRILDIVKKFGKKMPKKELSNRTRDIDLKTRDSALTSLDERGAILVEQEKNAAGRISYFITAI